MKKLLLLTLLIFAIGCSDSTETSNKKLTKQTFKKEWAFTVDAVELQCNDLVVVANGHKYPLTGFAKKYADSPLEDIWRENPNIPGTRVDISPVRELCGI